MRVHDLSDFSCLDPRGGLKSTIIYGGLSAATSIGDHLMRNDLFCHNLAALARRPEYATR